PRGRAAECGRRRSSGSGAAMTTPEEAAADAKTKLAAMLTHARADLAALEEIRRLASSRVEAWNAAGIIEAETLWEKLLSEHEPARALVARFAGIWQRQLAELDAVGIA